MIYADASFIVALFVREDEHWQRAWQWWRAEQGPILTVTRLGVFEAENTVRALVVAREIRPVEGRQALEGILRARLEGILNQRGISEHQLFPAATRLSQHHTTNAAFGALDILHVASALHLKASGFLSFDLRQGELAAREGLVVLP